MAQQFAKEVMMDGVSGRGASFFLALLAGIVAAALGALIWMGITLATHGFHVGYVALGIGALVGLAIRFAGNGRSMIFGILGGVLTLAGCLGGEILATIQLLVTPQHDFYATLIGADFTALITNIFNQTDPIMYLIYGIGIFEGYKLSMRK